ncbi:hypothetical protein DKX38_019009 [Salix brachista]|uniref:Uncharacterized protein n=1 Tax=Salix brachista TaxID=2182728 RepID=A0A5N5KPM9_9ROSI|nr:hypothetical protein DKX38_019009 [Salix brachista]
MASRLLWASSAASYLRISVSHRGFASGKPHCSTMFFVWFVDLLEFRNVEKEVFCELKECSLAHKQD